MVIVRTNIWEIIRSNFVDIAKCDFKKTNVVFFSETQTTVILNEHQDVWSDSYTAKAGSTMLIFRVASFC